MPGRVELHSNAQPIRQMPPRTENEGLPQGPCVSYCGRSTIASPVTGIVVVVVETVELVPVPEPATVVVVATVVELPAGAVVVVGVSFAGGGATPTGCTGAPEAE